MAPTCESLLITTVTVAEGPCVFDAAAPDEFACAEAATDVDVVVEEGGTEEI